jgi:hypothetical protein
VSPEWRPDQLPPTPIQNQNDYTAIRAQDLSDLCAQGGDGGARSLPQRWRREKGTYSGRVASRHPILSVFGYNKSKIWPCPNQSLPVPFPEPRHVVFATPRRSKPACVTREGLGTGEGLIYCRYVCPASNTVTSAFSSPASRSRE